MPVIPTPPDLDALEAKLPPSAVAKMRRVKQDAEDADVLASVAFADLEAAERAAELARSPLLELQGAGPDARAGASPDTEHSATTRSVLADMAGRVMAATYTVGYGSRSVDAHQLPAIQAEVQRLGGERDRRRALYEERKQRGVAGRALYKAVVKFVRDLPADRVAAVAPAAKASLMKGSGSDAQTVARLRDRLAERRADQHAVRSAPIPSAEAKRIATEQITTLAKTGAPDVSRVIEIGSLVDWPMKRIPALAGGETVDVLALLAWLNRDALIAATGREIDAVADDAGALSSDQRAAKLSAIAAEIMDIERAEEVLIERSAAEGAYIARRPDADPRAVLGIVA